MRHTVRVKAVLVVADNLLNLRDVLLPQISQIFLVMYEISPSTKNSSDVILEIKESTVKFPLCLLLHQPLQYLHAYMGCKRQHQKIGTILYRKRCNLLTSLSLHLDKIHLQTRQFL